MSGNGPIKGIAGRLRQLKVKLKAREGVPEYSVSCRLMREEIARLEIAQQAEKAGNVPL